MVRAGQSREVGGGLGGAVSISGGRHDEDEALSYAKKMRMLEYQMNQGQTMKKLGYQFDCSTLLWFVNFHHHEVNSSLNTAFVSTSGLWDSLDALTELPAYCQKTYFRRGWE